MIEQFPPVAGLRPALSDRHIEVMAYRIGLFERRGLSPKCAEAWACSLATRDLERDDRRVCIECSNLQRGMTCASKVKRTPASAPRARTPNLFQLQRCEAFNFQKP